EEKGTHPSEPVVEEHRYREPAGAPAASAAPAVHTAPADDSAEIPAQTKSAEVSESAGTEVITDTTARADTLLEEKPARQTICKVCKAKVSFYAVYCQVCGANQKELAASSKKVTKARARETELLITSIKTTSLIFFLGGLGLIVGVLLGAAFGVFKILLPELQPLLPEMLADTRGGLAGGLIFAAIGGITGFIFSAAAAAVIGSVYNMVAFIFGGIRFKTK
ncbi:MAG: hypothetical protein GY950_03050, partial [bacterium]|nr:hypothetical protein [bacterium]